MEIINDTAHLVLVLFASASSEGSNEYRYIMLKQKRTVGKCPLGRWTCIF